MHETSLQFAILFDVLPLGMAAIVGLLLAAFPALWTKTVREADIGRNHTMDGARGLLTLWVLTFHVDQVPWFVAPVGPLALPPGILRDLLATGFFVAPFFALTAMLFGGALMASGGRLATAQFLRRRFFRIVPGYAASVVVLVVAAFWLSGFQLRVAPVKLLAEIARWSMFGFVTRYDINGVELANAHGMLWTLPYEIGFYLLLPLLAWGQRLTRSPAVPFVALAILGAIWWPFIFFAGGVVAAALVGWRHERSKSVLQVAAVVCIALLVSTIGYTNAPLQALLLAPVLAAIARETWLFRWLRIRPLRYVGEISYSVYILHYPLLWVAFMAIGGPGPLATMGIAGRWAGLIGCGMAVLAIATLCYIFVERPFIAFGKSLERKPAPPVDKAAIAAAAPDSTLVTRRQEG